MNDLSASRRSVLITGAGGLSAMAVALAGPAQARPLDVPAALPQPGPGGTGGVFLQLPGVKGESLDVNHRDWVELTGFDWAVEMTGQPTTGGSGSGKPRPDAFQFTTSGVSAASPAMMAAAISGRAFQTAVVEWSKAGQGQKPYMRFNLGEVRITHYEIVSGGKGVDFVSMTAATISFTYRQQDQKGTLLAPITVTWDTRSGRVTGPTTGTP